MRYTEVICASERHYHIQAPAESICGNVQKAGDRETRAKEHFTKRERILAGTLGAMTEMGKRNTDKAELYKQKYDIINQSGPLQKC